MVDELLEPDDQLDNISRKNSNFKEVAIDDKLLSILKFCLDSKALRKDNPEYQEELLLKSVQMGKKTKLKTLVIGLDELLISIRTTNS